MHQVMELVNIYYLCSSCSPADGLVVMLPTDGEVMNYEK